MNKALGLVHLKLNEETRKLERYEPEVFTELRDIPHQFEIVTHEVYVDEIIKNFKA
jgi:hypothetical protein